MLLAFITGLAQVFLVAFQVRQVAERARVWQIAAVGCAISAVWVFNVRAATDGFWPAAAYVVGAGAGTLVAQLVPVGRRRPSEGKADERPESVR